MTHQSFAGANKKTLRYELQGDSGANCTATDRKELLWQIKYFATPIKVKAIDGESNKEGEHGTIQEIGAGILKIVDDKNHIMDHYCLLIPNSTDTVISLDKSMRNDRSIVKFQQVGTVYGTGYIKLYDEKDQEINTVTMEERNDLWYASNPILMPPTSAGPRNRNAEEPSCHRINKTVTQATESNTTDLDADNSMHSSTIRQRKNDQMCPSAQQESSVIRAKLQNNSSSGTNAPGTLFLALCAAPKNVSMVCLRCPTPHQSTANFATW